MRGKVDAVTCRCQGRASGVAGRAPTFTRRSPLVSPNPAGERRPMRWDGIAVLGMPGLALVASPQSFFRRSTDAGRDARLIRGFGAVGALFLHLAALFAFLK